METQKRDGMLGFRLLWHSAQPGRHSCQLYAPAAFYSQGNSVGTHSCWRLSRPKGCWMRIEELGHSENFKGTNREEKPALFVLWHSASSRLCRIFPVQPRHSSKTASRIARHRCLLSSAPRLWCWCVLLWSEQICADISRLFVFLGFVTCVCVCV